MPWNGLDAPPRHVLAKLALTLVALEGLKPKGTLWHLRSNVLELGKQVLFLRTQLMGCSR